MSLLKETIIGANSLMPVSFVITVAGAVFWLASLSKDTEANAAAYVRMEKALAAEASARTTLEIEIVQELKSNNISSGQLEKDMAVVKSDVARIIRLLEAKPGGGY